MTTICHFPFWFQWKHLSRLPTLWNFQLVDSKCFQIKLITNKFFFTGRCHFQLSNIRITKRFWLAGDYDYLRGAISINHQVALRANFKMYSRSAKGGEKGDPNRNPWLAKMPQIWLELYPYTTAHSPIQFLLILICINDLAVLIHSEKHLSSLSRFFCNLFIFKERSGRYKYRKKHMICIYNFT